MRYSKMLKLCTKFVQTNRRLSGPGGVRDPPTVSSKGPQQVSSGFATAALPSASLKELDDLPEICRVPLSESPPNFPKAVYAQPTKSGIFDTTVTTLKNGLRIASEPKFDEFCTLGVVINAGSRYEVAYPSGVSQFIEKLAFNTTESFNSRDDTLKLLEQYGGMVDCQSTKDTIIYAASCHKSGLEPVIKLLADAVLRPNFTDSELSLAKSIVSSFIETVNMKPEPEEILQDWIHAAAYRDNTLGLPKICPVDSVEKIRRDLLYSYMSTYFVPSRMVLAGVAVPDHKQFVDLVEKYFVAAPPAWVKNSNLLSSVCPAPDHSLAQYTGGIVKVEKDLSNVGMSINPFPDLAHFVLGLESCSYKDDDFVAFCVLNSLMGGGGSFSAGGPGKGMYTRLYLNVLNQCHWMYNATSFNLSYADSGLFYIHASGDPKNMFELVSVIVQEFIRIAGSVSSEELERAKIQLQSMLMMNLEQRPVMFEDVGRQVLAHGHRKSPLAYIEDIKRITEKDLKRIADRMLSSKASVVGYGNLKGLPDYEKVDRAIAKRDVRELKSSLFNFKR